MNINHPISPSKELSNAGLGQKSECKRIASLWGAEAPVPSQRCAAKKPKNQ